MSFRASLIDTIESQLFGDKILAASMPNKGEPKIYFESPISLTFSLSTLYPNSTDFIFLDCPRSSNKVSADLIYLEGNNVTINSLKENDISYRYSLKVTLFFLLTKIKIMMSNHGVLTISSPPSYSGIIRQLCDEIFGINAYLGELVYQSRVGGGSDSTYMSIDHELLLIYAKNPENINRLMVKKSQKELSQYNLEDNKSKYTWDTYIRKQARNYYKIKCPDGSILEKDENGNKISWLWSEQTFKDKKDKEIRFEKVNGNWKLYYKDRVKEFKILRSLILNSTELSDVFESNESIDTKGRGLLSQTGTSEIKAFTGKKPEYLKSSLFYEFLIKVFCKPGDSIYIPFSEYGSSSLGFFKHKEFQELSLLSNNSEGFKPFIQNRIKKELSEKKVSFENSCRELSYVDFLKKEGMPEVDVVVDIIKSKEKITEFEVESFDNVNFFCGSIENKVVFAFYQDNPQYSSSVYQLLINEDFYKHLKTKVENRQAIFYTMAKPDNDLMRKYFINKSSVFMLPFALYNS